MNVYPYFPQLFSVRLKPVRDLDVMQFSFCDFWENLRREGRSILMAIDGCTTEFTHVSWYLATFWKRRTPW